MPSIFVSVWRTATIHLLLYLRVRVKRQKNI